VSEVNFWREFAEQRIGFIIMPNILLFGLVHDFLSFQHIKKSAVPSGVLSRQILYPDVIYRYLVLEFSYAHTLTNDCIYRKANREAVQWWKLQV
jgi:hypothetical protein